MLERTVHFAINKYLITPIAKNKYALSYDFEHKALWFRVPKVATRTIDRHFRNNTSDEHYVMGSPTGYLPQRYTDFFKFAFVRNPVGRFLSAWRNKVVAMNHFGFGRSQYERMQNIDVFIDWVEQQDLEQADRHIMPQHLQIDLNHIDFVGRFEAFDRDMGIASDKLGMKFDPSVHLNRTVRRDEEDISDITARRIAMLYSQDIRLFYTDLICLLM